MDSTSGVRLPVLMYHHIGPRHPQTHYELTIEPKQFARQVRWLVKNGYTGIRASDWLARKLHGSPLPKKPVLLTFDDAYADTFEYALPILAQYNFRATVFVVSAMVGQRDAWNESEVSKSVLKLATREQILEWSLRDMEMGGHGRTHADLTALDELHLQAEVVGGKKELALIAGEEPTSFAYPYGSYDEALEKVVRKNYELAFSATPGVNTLSTDSHLLLRLMVDPRCSIWQFGQCLKTGRKAEPSLAGRVRRKITGLIRKS